MNAVSKVKKSASTTQMSSEKLFNNPFAAARHCITVKNGSKADTDAMLQRLDVAVNGLFYSRPMSDPEFFEESRKVILEKVGIQVTAVPGSMYKAAWFYGNNKELPVAYQLVNLSGGFHTEPKGYQLYQSAQFNMKDMLQAHAHQMEEMLPHKAAPSYGGGTIRALKAGFDTSSFTEQRSVFLSFGKEGCSLGTALGHCLNGNIPERRPLSIVETEWLAQNAVVVGAAKLEGSQAQATRQPNAISLLNAQRTASELGFVVDIYDFEVERFNSDVADEKVLWLRLNCRQFKPLSL